MPDSFRKTKSLYASTANTFGTGTGVTITPASVSGLPTDTEITLTFDRVNSAGTATPAAMERIIGTISGSNFVVRTSPSTGRGADGTSDAAHTSPVVEYIPNAKDMNDAIDGILIGHNQTGAHIASLPLTTPKITTSINDENGNEVIKTPATGSAVNEITVTNAATANDPLISATGGDTNIGLKIHAKGTGKVKIGAADLQFPNADGTSGQAIVTDAAGVLSFASVSGLSIGSANGSTSGPTTASTSYVDFTDMSVTFTSVSGKAVVIMSAGAQNNGAGNGTFIALSMDAAAEVGERFKDDASANETKEITTMYAFSGLSAGSHTVKGRWKVGAGTGTSPSTNRTIIVLYN